MVHLAMLEALGTCCLRRHARIDDGLPKPTPLRRRQLWTRLGAERWRCGMYDPQVGEPAVVDGPYRRRIVGGRDHAAPPVIASRSTSEAFQRICREDRRIAWISPRFSYSNTVFGCT